MLDQLLQWWPWIAGAAGTLSGMLVAAWLMRDVPIDEPIPPPQSPDPAEVAKQQAANEQRKREIEERKHQEQAEHDRQRAEARAAEERQQQEKATRLSILIQALANAVPFTSKVVQVGMKKTGERAVGVHINESPFPADDRDVRPMRDVSELPQMQLAELLGDEDVLLARICEGTALVNVDIQHTPIMEPIHEPVYEERRLLRYLLLDASGSMMEAYGTWKPPIWRNLVPLCLEIAFREEVATWLREFDTTTGPLHQTSTQEEVKTLQEYIRNRQTSGGTQIGQAILTAIADLATQKFDQVDMTIITDGEDEGSLADAAEIRAALEGANIRLHAVLLGVKNEALRAIADSYIVVREDYTVEPLYRRTA